MSYGSARYGVSVTKEVFEWISLTITRSAYRSVRSVSQQHPSLLDVLVFTQYFVVQIDILRFFGTICNWNETGCIYQIAGTVVRTMLTGVIIMWFEVFDFITCLTDIILTFYLFRLLSCRYLLIVFQIYIFVIINLF